MFSILQDRALLAEYNYQESSLQFITDSAMKCFVYFRPHITLVSKASQQLNVWTYLPVKSKSVPSYSCTSALSGVACDVSRYEISTTSPRRLVYPGRSPWEVGSSFCLRCSLTDFKLIVWIVSSLLESFLETSCTHLACKDSFTGKKNHLKQHLLLNAPTTLLGQESLEIQWVVTHVPLSPRSVSSFHSSG